LDEPVSLSEGDRRQRNLIDKERKRQGSFHSNSYAILEDSGEGKGREITPGKLRRERVKIEFYRSVLLRGSIRERD